MRVDDIGDHICCFVPGGRSLVTVGMPAVTNTSQFSGMSRVLTSSFMYHLLSRPLRRRAWPQRFIFRCIYIVNHVATCDGLPGRAVGAPMVHVFSVRAVFSAVV